MKKILLSTLVIIFTFTIFPVSTFAAPKTPVKSKIEQLKGENLEEQGVKSWLIKQATKLLTTAIRKGGDEVAEILKYVSKDAAKTFKKNANGIARGLDKIAEIPDLTIHIVEDKIFTFMIRELGMNGGIAKEISKGIAGTLNLLL